jgi:hypothetical protein
MNQKVKKNFGNIHDMSRMSSSLVYNHSDGRYCLQKAGNPAQTIFPRAYSPTPEKFEKNPRCTTLSTDYPPTSPSIDTINQPVSWPSGYGASFR